MINNNQRDSQWSSIPLGFPKHGQNIGSHGCTVSVIGDIADLTPKEVNERLQKVGGFQESLVIWNKIQEAIPWLRFEWRGYEYDNNKVLANLPCLVEVDGTRIGGTKHWVLYIGNKRMYDPWTGKEKDTSYYPATGYAIIKKVGEKPVDSSDELKTCLDILHNKVIPEKEGLQREYETFKKEKGEEVKSLENKIEDLEQRVKEANTDRDQSRRELEELKEEDYQRVQLLSQKLLSRGDWAGIIAEIDRLLMIEDQKREIEKGLSAVATELKGYKDMVEELEAREKALHEATDNKKQQKGGENIWQKLLKPLNWIIRVFGRRSESR